MHVPNSGFENHGLRKKRSLTSIWTENASIQTKNGVEALSMMAFIVFGTLVRKVWPPLLYQSRIWKFQQMLAGSTKCPGGL